MNTKFNDVIKKSSLFKPNYLGIFLPTLLLGCVLIYLEPITIPLVFLAVILSYKLEMRRHKQRMTAYSKYLDDMIENVQKDNHFAIAYMQVGIGIFDTNGLLQWYNNKFQDIVSRPQILGYHMESLLPVQKGFFDIISEQEQVLQTVSIEERTYTLQGRRIRSTSKEENQSSVSVYLYDVTELSTLRQKYNDTKLALCYVRCDNYDEVIRSLSDRGVVTLNGALSSMLTKWVKTNKGFIVHLGNDSAMMGFNHREMITIIKERFDILNSAHLINVGSRMTPTLSIGVAMDGDNLNEQLEKASDALNMALNRGGDQVVVNNHDRLNYFGATGTVVTKANRVRARIVAQMLREEIGKASHILVAGHTGEDFDSLGSAIGIAVMARSMQKPVHIVQSISDSEYQHSKTVFAKYIENNPYDDLILTSERDVQPYIDDNTLLILVDHHRKQLCAMPLLLDKISHRILIDHHRRSEDIIANINGIYQEPSSSSTSEMITELFPYFDEDLELTPYEATKLYLGIVLDSKNFTVQTNERTFEAAAFLRRFGANITLVNELFAESFDKLRYRSKLIAEAKFITPGFAVVTNSVKEKTSETTVLSAQAADELVQAKGVHGACVMTQFENTNTISMNARSDGTVYNVQLMMEALGGGGHQNMAACQIKNKTLEEALELLAKQIKQQEEDETK